MVLQESEPTKQRVTNRSRIKITYPKFASTNFDEIEKAGGLELQDHHREDLLNEGQNLFNDFIKLSFKKYNSRFTRKPNEKSTRIARQLLQSLEGNYSPELPGFKNSLVKFIDKASSVDRLKKGQPSKLSKIINGIYKIWRDAGGKGIGCHNNPDTYKPEGKALDFICKYFDQLKIQYSINTVAKIIILTGKGFRAAQKTKDGVPSHKIITRPAKHRLNPRRH